MGRGRKGRTLVATVVAGGVALAGCATSGSGGDGGAAATATLSVHIGLFGGPMRPGGGMALSNSPVGNENVTARSSAGGKTVAETDAHGVATLHLPAGRYTVFSTYCGTGPEQVVLETGRTTRVQITCAVP